MSTTRINAELELEINRCSDCGRYWALEQNVNGNCPRCARIKSDDRWNKIYALEKRVSALKGALTRKKKS